MNDQTAPATVEETMEELEVEQECPVCLAKTITTEALPYLADMLRGVAAAARSNLEQGNSVDSDKELLVPISNIRKAIQEVRVAIEALKQCDCGDEPLPAVEPLTDEEDQAYYDSYKVYDV